jgi:hypothetical protein
VSSFETVAYGPERREDYLRLLRDTRGGGGLSGEEFDWWFERNPTGPKLMAVAQDDGRVLGVASHTPYRVRIGGEVRLVTASVHAGTEPEARGRGIFRGLEERNEREAAAAGAAATIAFASKATQWIFLGPLGWTEIGRLRIWARPLRPRPRQREVEEVEFGPETDAVYEAAAREWGSHVVRDAGFLRWRYGDSPWGYRTLGVRREGRLAGFAVLRDKLHRGKPVSILADLVVRADEPRATRALLRAAAAASARESQALFALPQGRMRFAAAGFVPTPLSLHFVAKSLQPDIAMPSDPAAWHVTLGDTDFF